MKYLIILITLAITLVSQELKIKANEFSSDEKKGISTFIGEVSVVRGDDELSASKVTVFTDKDHQPTKFIALGDVSFKITTQEGAKYKGKAQKTIYNPIKKEYYFYQDVYLKQVDKKKEIIGDEVVLKTIEGKAYAKGAEKEPVIMIFDIKEKGKE
ncbi:MAG: lipopolysaccharide transport periplasmic protein LptA [Campylobacterota bacterium]|nr:lipopolysaccharide transport periplasmic protein LptA [Campylobacterota bacterium]